MKDLFIVGAGGQAKVVIDCLDKSSRIDEEFRMKILDENPAKHGTLVLGIPVVGTLSDTLRSPPPNSAFHLALGNNAARKKISKQILEAEPGAHFETVSHPNACVSRWSQIGAGSFIAAQSVIGPDAKIGSHVLINHGATVDHDTVIGDFCHIAPGANLCGTVSIGEGTLMGVGSSIIPNMSVGEWCTVGAGSVVVRSLPDNLTVKGNPAK